MSELSCIEAVHLYLIENPDAWEAEDSGKAVARAVADKRGMNTESVYRAIYRYYGFIPGPGRPKTIDKETLKSMKQDYSNWVGGGGKTVQRIAAKYGISPSRFRQIRDDHNWVHDSAPFLKSDLLGDMTEEELIDDLAAQEEHKLAEHWQEKREQRLRQKAREYELLRKGTYEPFFKFVEAHPPKDVSSQVIPPVDRSTETLAVLHPADPHIGKMDVHGRKSVIPAIKQCCENLMSRLQRVNPERVALTLGNDWFHVDGFDRATTSGTAQDLNMSVDEMVGLGYKTAVEVIDIVRSFGRPVDIYVVRSNHDDFASSHFGWALEYMYRNVTGVTVSRTNRSRQYFRWGKNLIGLTHGHKEKLGELPELMANEEPELWGSCPFRYWVTGHLHYTRDRRESETGGHGTHIFQGPSVSLTDRWHDQNGYVLARRGMACYTFGAQSGHLDRMVSNVEVEID